ncbi:MAG: hypothetical protein J0L56_05915 [Chitinophagales bacterium]|nr:hypothetical protein [Chitinophagales bacterium]
MKKIIALLSLITVVIIACTTNQQTNSLLSKPGDVKADEYSITIDRDTTLVTKNGALLNIPKGALATDNGNTVVLEIKEAYSLEQMIRYGLTTSSGDEPLSSGGMIYVNAKAGQNVTIKQAIKVAIPTDYLSPGMQLFKGEETKDGNINWIEPTALPENQQLNTIEKGEQLFESKCAGCHAIGKDMKGPDLAHFVKRFPIMGEIAWRYYEHGYIMSEYDYPVIEKLSPDTSAIQKDYSRKYYHPDPYPVYKCNLLSRFASTGPRMFTDSVNQLIESVYKYIQNESDRRQLALPAHAYLLDCADSCIQYRQRITDLQKLQKNTAAKRRNLVGEAEPSTEEVKIKTGTVPEPPVQFDDVVSPTSNKGVYYQFSIETFGWYNIDILLKNVTGNVESELIVRISGSYREKLDIFLVIPEQKIYTKAGKKKGSIDEYVFAYTSGKIFLPQNAKAYILAMTEAEATIAFSLMQFTTSQTQQLDVELKTASKEEFNAAISSLNISGMKIEAKDSKNAAEIRKTDADLKTIEEELKKAENLKPRGCDCSCWNTGADATTFGPK